jgi:hypothetical protein
VDLKLDHPITDPKLPSFMHRTLRGLREDLQRAEDVYCCLRGVKDRYLPQEPEEPQQAYQGRLQRSVFSDFFRFSIQGFAGVLSKFSLINPPATFEAAQQNIDGEGSDLKTWFDGADTFALRDGGVWLQVEMPNGIAESAAEEILTGRRPYLVRRPRTRGINWQVSIVNGLPVLDWVMFLEVTEEPVADGFGSEMVTRYRQVGAGWQEVFELKQDSSGKWSYVSEGQVPILAANGQPLTRCPVVWYPADPAPPGEGELPLRQVVEHCIEHFQRRSDLREKDHKINMAVPVVVGRRPAPPMTPAAMAAAASGMAPAAAPLVIGPNTVVELEDGGSFTFAEPSAASLSFTQAQITEVEKLIARQTLGFLFGDGGAVKTATQAGMEGAQTESAILRMSRRKRSVAQSLMAIWCEFTGETLAPDAGIDMDETVFEPPLSAQDVAQLQSLTGGLELLSQRTAIGILQRRRYNLVTADPEEELQRLAAEVPDPATDPGVNDFGALPPA